MHIFDTKSVMVYIYAPAGPGESFRQYIYVHVITFMDTSTCPGGELAQFNEIIRTSVQETNSCPSKEFLKKVSTY